MANEYWVTWKDESNTTDARNTANIWGPQASAPPQLSGFFRSGPFATKADAEAYKAAIGTGSIKPPPGTPLLGGQKIPNPLTGLAAIGDFFQRLTQADVWERVGEVVLGLILICAGVAKLTHAVPIATKIAKTAEKVAPLAA
jgi:hypothetical protein